MGVNAWPHAATYNAGHACLIVTYIIELYILGAIYYIDNL